MIHHSNSLKNKIAQNLNFKRNFSLSISHKTSQSFNTIITHYSHLIDNSLSFKPFPFCNFVHPHLIKISLNTHTFLGNRLLDFYTKVGTIDDSLKLFDDIPNKNSFTWNVLLMGLFKFGHFDKANILFDEMPQRDAVSWNTMILGYASNGFLGYALGIFGEMQTASTKPSAYTFSIVMSCLWSTRQGKEIHGGIIRSGLGFSNVVLCNGLIDMYSKFELIDYAFGVFLSMEELDVISWNTLILGCGRSDYGELALTQFCAMWSSGFSPDQHTISTVITVCSNLRALENGKQVFALCAKMGFHSNAIVTSATIDMFSKCNRLEDSVRLFEEIHVWDVAVCNSMISCYVKHDHEEDAFWLFVLSLRANIRPTEFTLSSILASTSSLVLLEKGIQIHCMVIKLGLESETIVASSLIDMYAKVGSIHSAIRIFVRMTFKDLVSWNTMIMGFARNGRELEALETFDELLEQGTLPDRITLVGVLLACSHRGLLNEGSIIFSSMEEKYGIIPGIEHYACVVDMMYRAGKLSKAMEIVEAIPLDPNALIWETLLLACRDKGDMWLTERVADILMELEPHSSLPYMVLAQAYELMGRWESLARVRKAMKDRGIKNMRDCSWIGIKNQVFVFKENPVSLCGSEEVYSILRLLIWEMMHEAYSCQLYAITVEDYDWEWREE